MNWSRTPANMSPSRINWAARVILDPQHHGSFPRSPYFPECSRLHAATNSFVMRKCSSPRKQTMYIDPQIVGTIAKRSVCKIISSHGGPQHQSVTRHLPSPRHLAPFTQWTPHHSAQHFWYNEGVANSKQLTR